MTAGPARMMATRRQLLAGTAAGAALLLLPRGAAAANGASHGLSTFGDLKYSPQFAAFDYVNPDAPKGGRLSVIPDITFGSQNPETFNSLNPYILKGDAAVGIDMTLTSLMVRALDEPDAVYGLVAASAELKPDGTGCAFDLRPEARFHDGSPLTADDVVFSYGILKSDGHPDYAETLRDLVSVTAPSPARVEMVFSGRQSRGYAATIATLPIFSRAHFAGRPFAQSSLDAPLGSGPYRVGAFEPGRFIEYERVRDWWGAGLPVARGHYNFDIVRYDYYRERSVALEAFKAGQYLLREEFTSLAWATQYDFPALAEGKVVKLELEDRSPSGAQGWHFNLRRAKFADIRVREAIGLAFDFEWSNRNLFYGSYTRAQSPFVNSAFEATGKPTADELVLLEPFRGLVAETVFGPALTQPVSDGSGRDRVLLKRASDLLTEAGWPPGSDGIRHKDGTRLTLEFLDASSSFGRILGPFIGNLRLIGIDAEFRVVDPSQYQKRIDEFDFDIVSRRNILPPTPDETLRQLWHSDQAELPGSSNIAGLKDAAVDALLARALKAPSRAELTLTCRALDRVLRASRYWIPQWHKPSHWIAMWDIYRGPAVKPRYARGIVTTWWLDETRARALSRGL